MKIPAIPIPDRHHTLLLLLAISISCYGCTKYSPYVYKVTAVHLVNVDNSGNSPLDDSTGPIATRAYGIHMKYTSQLYGPNKNADPDGGTYVLASPLTVFTIYSSTDFDSTHPAGASLNDYFLYGESFDQPSAPFSLDSALAGGWVMSTGQSFAQTGTSQPWESDNYLFLMQPPAAPGYRTFLVNIRFADNTQFTDSTSVTLQ